jgi:putative transposase
MQTCIVHQICGSIRYVTYADRKAVARDLKPVYRAANAHAALQALEALARPAYPGENRTR